MTTIRGGVAVTHGLHGLVVAVGDVHGLHGLVVAVGDAHGLHGLVVALGGAHGLGVAVGFPHGGVVTVDVTSSAADEIRKSAPAIFLLSEPSAVIWYMPLG